MDPCTARIPSPVHSSRAPVLHMRAQSTIQATVWWSSHRVASAAHHPSSEHAQTLAGVTLTALALVCPSPLVCGSAHPCPHLRTHGARVHHLAHMSLAGSRSQPPPIIHAHTPTAADGIGAPRVSWGRPAALRSNGSCRPCAPPCPSWACMHTRSSAAGRSRRCTCRRRAGAAARGTCSRR